MQSTKKPFNILIIEEDNMFSSSIRNMLKKMGFNEDKIHKAPNLAIFKALISKYPFDLIICRYEVKGKPIGRKYLYLYQECNRFTYDCAFVFVAEQGMKGFSKERREIEELFPDNILEVPFSYNEFKPLINEGLFKRKILSTVYHELEKGHYKRALHICEQVSSKNNSYWLDLYRIVIEAYIKQKKYDIALKTLEDLRKRDASEWTLIKLIETHATLGNEEDVLALAHEFEVLGYPEHPIVSQITAHRSILDSDIKTALGLIKKIALRYPHLIQVTINLCYLYIEQEEYRKAYSFLIKIDYDMILNEQQYYCLEEMKTFIEIMLDAKRGTPYDKRALGRKLKTLLNYDGTPPDTPDLSKKFYLSARECTGNNPVCTSKKYQGMFEETTLVHRRLLLMAMAYHLGFMEELTAWINVEQEKTANVHHINEAVIVPILKKLAEMNVQKQARLKQADDMEEQGYILEPLAIRSREIPSLILHHLNFINAMTKYKLSPQNNLKLLESQFKRSITVVLTNLLLQNPNHPKVANTKKVRDMVLNKLKIAIKMQLTAENDNVSA